jgi:hypothetical protein
MTEISERNAAAGEQPEDAATRFTNANKHALHFMMGTQRAVFEEMVYASYELLDRTRTEMQLFTEFASKMAAAHSIRDIKTVCEECSRHQIDFIRGENERLFKHGERMIETTSNLIGGWWQN